MVPAAEKLDGVTDFTIAMPGAWAAGTVAVDGADSSGVVDPGGVPCAVAVLVTDPASTSACVVPHVAVQVYSAPGAREAFVQVIADRGGRSVSFTWTPVRSTFPVLATAKE